MPRAELRGFERVAIPIADAIQTRPTLQRMARPLWRHGGKNFVGLLTSNLYRPHGLHHARELEAPEGTLLIANHRSFFDLYFISNLLIDEVEHLMGRILYPVRKDFFYDAPAGLALNLALTCGSMWPPIFRDARSSTLNPIAMRQVGAAMRRGTFVGLHPEGRRNHDGDPWTLSKLKPGLGQIVVASHPDVRVLPAFILGTDNDFWHTISRNRRPPGQRGEPVRIWFDAPLRCGDLVQAHGDDPMAITQAAMAKVQALAELDREAWLADPSDI